MLMEDVELSLRLKAAGRIVFHRKGISKKTLAVTAPGSLDTDCSSGCLLKLTNPVLRAKSKLTGFAGVQIS